MTMIAYLLQAAESGKSVVRILTDDTYDTVERGSSVVEWWTRHQVSPGSNPPLLPFRKLGIFVLSTDALVDSAA